MSFAASVIAFLVAVSILVSFHEFGHYLAARRLNVKVLKFSIGFGKPLWSRVSGADRTEYVLASVPLGGYVKMLDEREAPVQESEAGRAFNRQPVGSRMVIVAAGPLFNFLLAIIAYWFMFMLGVTGPRPLVGMVDSGSIAAAAQLRAGDEIVRVDGHATPTWQEASTSLLKGALASGVVSLDLKREGKVMSARLDLSDTAHLLSEGDLLDKLGIAPARPHDDPIVGGLLPGDPAERAGVRSGDRILSVDGNPMPTWTAFARYVRTHPGQTLNLHVERDHHEVDISLTSVTANENGQTIGRVGAYGYQDPQAADDDAAEFYATVRYNPLAALGNATTETWKISALTLKVLGKLVIGEASVRNISGPITIAKVAGASAAAGLPAFLGMLAFFSISIGILNLLPIPVLDGGHLLFYLVEAIKGGPVPEAVLLAGQRIGFAVLAVLITLALYNDITRLTG